MRKTFIALAIFLSASAQSEEIVSYDNLFFEVDFLRDVSCSIADTYLDFGNIEQTEQYEDVIYINGSCSNDIKLILYPTDASNSLRGVVDGTSATYNIALETFGDNYKNNTDNSYCSSGQSFANENEDGCHIYYNVTGGNFSIPVVAKIKIEGDRLNRVVSFSKKIPISVKVTYDK